MKAFELRFHVADRLRPYQDSTTFASATLPTLEHQLSMIEAARK
jgi:hypothetical protein